jgi:prevent-host-death family protein
MRTVSALDVRKRFGQFLDDAAGGERIVIERAGQPLAALVPLSDLQAVDPTLAIERRLAALDRIERFARTVQRPPGFDAVTAIRDARGERTKLVSRRRRG